jgi:hypothetical protein
MRQIFFFLSAIDLIISMSPSLIFISDQIVIIKNKGVPSTALEGAYDEDGFTSGDGVAVSIGLITTFTPIWLGVLDFRYRSGSCDRSYSYRSY